MSLIFCFVWTIVFGQLHCRRLDNIIKVKVIKISLFNFFFSFFQCFYIKPVEVSTMLHTGNTWVQMFLFGLKTKTVWSQLNNYSAEGPHSQKQQILIPTCHPQKYMLYFKETICFVFKCLYFRNPNFQGHDKNRVTAFTDVNLLMSKTLCQFMSCHSL